VEQAAKKVTETLVKKGDDYGSFRPDLGGDISVLEDINIVWREAQRHPPVNSDYIPLP
jgi:hypothetical protein